MSSNIYVSKKTYFLRIENLLYRDQKVERNSRCELYRNNRIQTQMQIGRYILQYIIPVNGKQPKYLIRNAKNKHERKSQRNFQG